MTYLDEVLAVAALHNITKTELDSFTDLCDLEATFKSCPSGTALQIAKVYTLVNQGRSIDASRRLWRFSSASVAHKKTRSLARGLLSAAAKPKQRKRGNSSRPHWDR